jgi:hypothetical protein
MDLGEVTDGQVADRMDEGDVQEPRCLADRRWLRRPAPGIRELPTLAIVIPLPAHA